MIYMLQTFRKKQRRQVKNQNYAARLFMKLVNVRRAIHAKMEAKLSSHLKLGNGLAMLKYYITEQLSLSTEIFMLQLEEDWLEQIVAFSNGELGSKLESLKRLFGAGRDYKVRRELLFDAEREREYTSEGYTGFVYTGASASYIGPEFTDDEGYTMSDYDDNGAYFGVALRHHLRWI